MKKFLLIAIAALLSLLGAESPYADTPASPVVKITDASGGVCTAFYIGNDEFVTGGHCLFEAKNSPKPYKVTNDDGLSISAVAGVVYNTDAGPLPDFMILVATAPVNPEWKPEELNCDYFPTIGDDVSTLGYPGNSGGAAIYAKGYVSGLPRLMWQYDGGWGIPVWVASMTIFSGHSGSPIYHDGKVVGVLVGINPFQNGWTYVQPIQAVCDLLRILKK